MDIQLPDVDGLTAVRQLRQDAVTRHLKIVALTAFAMKGDESKMLENGCDGYIAKPIRYHSFLEEVRRVLGP
jgi:two-component system cell cycle response regulator DivK